MVALSLMYISVTTKKQSFSLKDKSYDFSLKIAVNCDKKIIFLTCYFNNWMFTGMLLGICMKLKKESMILKETMIWLVSFRWLNLLDF